MKNDIVEQMLKNGKKADEILEQARRDVVEHLVTRPEVVDSVEKILRLIVEAKKKTEEFINLAILLTVRDAYHSEWGLVMKSAEEANTFMKEAQDTIRSLGTTISIPEIFIEGLREVDLNPETPE